MMKKILVISLLLVLISAKWNIGVNFNPSTSINQLEFWQAETFDPVTIDRELGYAAGAGFNTLRTFIHFLVWQQNPEGFKNRFRQYLDIAEKHNLVVMPALFDDCWNPNPQLGKQPDAIPGVHNSQWVQCPGVSERDESKFPQYGEYVKDLLTSFKNDKRIFLWDLYNEPGNSNHILNTLPLLKYVFQSAREAQPTQPVTSGVWNYDASFQQLNDFQIANSDIVTFHAYGDLEYTKNIAQGVIQKANGKQVLCSEWMARTAGSTFKTHLQWFKDNNLGALSWGLVLGKTQTAWPWNSPVGSPLPTTWFHDVFWADGRPFDQAEVDLIKHLSLSQDM